LRRKTQNLKGFPIEPAIAGRDIKILTEETNILSEEIKILTEEIKFLSEEIKISTEGSQYWRSGFAYRHT
jgi:hypothetical protein